MDSFYCTFIAAKLFRLRNERKPSLPRPLSSSNILEFPHTRLFHPPPISREPGREACPASCAPSLVIIFLSPVESFQTQRLRLEKWRFRWAPVNTVSLKTCGSVGDRGRFNDCVACVYSDCGEETYLQFRYCQPNVGGQRFSVQLLAKSRG